VSEEDLAGERRGVDWLARQAPVVVVTCGSRGAVAHAGGRVIEQPAFAALSRDPTGAGDVFAAAFFVRLHDAGDVASALAFAAAAAACAVEAEGLAGIAGREEVEARLRA
jgi:sugar/nucleoside kinase (ribokinase family)